jgi:hypothetical protein
VQAASIEFDLMPLQIAQLTSPQPVPVGEQDHGGVAVAIAASFASSLDQPLDLAAGEITPSSAD